MERGLSAIGPRENRGERLVTTHPRSFTDDSRMPTDRPSVPSGLVVSGPAAAPPVAAGGAGARCWARPNRSLPRSPARMLLSVVVVTYQSRDHILACLRSIDADRGALAAEVLVLDNASADGTADLVRREAPGVRVIETGGNLGYAKAVNRGIAESAGGAVLVLNPDCIVRPGALAALTGWLDAHPRCAVAAPRIRNPDGTIEWSARSYPGALTFLFNRYSLLTRLFPGNPWSRSYLLSDWDHDSARSVDWVSGAAMCVRRAAIDEVGGMDEAFFMFNEDVDWCRRFTQAGWSVDYEPRAEVVHAIGASKGRVSEKVILERHRGMIHYLRKHHPTNPIVEWAAASLIMARARLMLAANARKR